MFASLYLRVMQWARHVHAPRILGTLSFFESFIFPVPTDVMLIPMAIARPHQATYLGTLTTATSVLGGIFGYLLGMLAFPTLVEPVLQHFGYMPKFENVQAWFVAWGFWVILVAGFTPIPYKIFTITAGLVGIAFLPFVLASIIGRGARFYLVAYLMAWGGPRLENTIHNILQKFGWAVAGLFVAVILVYYYLHL